MLRFCYYLLSCLGLLAAVPFLLPRIKKGRYRRITLARLGLGSSWLPAVRPGGIWLHALSVGEVNSSLPLLRALLGKFPQKPFYFSVATAAGLATAQAACRDYPQVTVFIRPLDLFWAVSRLLRHLNPKLYCLVESDIWPGWQWAAHDHNIPAILVNARINARTFWGYKRLGSLSRDLMNGFDLIFCQSGLDKSRLRELGLAEEKVRVEGNLKFDGILPRLSREERQSLAQDWGLAGRSVIVAGSTHAGEEEICLEAWAALRQSYPETALLLAPREVRRAEELARLAAGQGWRVRLLSQKSSEAGTDILILDVLGALAKGYALGRAAFVGGSLRDHGGHNLLEPAAQAVPPLFGPYTADFAEMADELTAAGGGMRLLQDGDLLPAWRSLLADPDKARTMGQAAWDFCRIQRGAAQRLADELGGKCL